VSNLKAKPGNDGKSVILSWNHAEDNECNYLIYRSFNGDGLQMFATANGGSNSYIDNNVSVGGSYTYAIKVISNDGNKSPLSESIKIEVK
jgi:fibronectin type 3 domain-containing protein